jgi:hypothetical protein
LLLRVSTVSSEEALLWFTRRCVPARGRRWWAGSKRGRTWRSVVDPYQKFAGFQHEKALSQAQFGKQYVDQPRTRPLGDNPLLVTSQRRAGRAAACHRPAADSGRGDLPDLDEPLLHGFTAAAEAVERRVGLQADLPWGSLRPGGERTQ